MNNQPTHPVPTAKSERIATMALDKALYATRWATVAIVSNVVTLVVVAINLYFGGLA